MFNKKLLLTSAILISGALHTASAQGWNTFGLNSMNRYVDFSATSPFSNHTFFPKWSVGTANPGTTKYFLMNLQGKSTGSCFIVSTSGASASGTVTDLVAYTPQATFKKIDDDGPNSGKLPYFKVFTYHDAAFIISAKNDTHNNRDWNLSITEMAAANPNACKALSSSVPMYDSQNEVVSPGPTTVN